MSCDMALAGWIWLASFSDPGQIGAAPPIPPMAAAANPLAREPLFAEIVRRAGSLEARVDALRRAASPAPDVAELRAEGLALADLDLKGHLDLARRGTDGDLKCILKGISQDLPRRLNDLAQASPAQRPAALDELFYLLRDNVEVITAPPKAAV